MTAADVAPLAHAMGWPEYGMRHRWQEQLDGKREMFVANIDGTSVGSVSINEEPEVPGFLHLFALDVSPHLQRRGIGTLLIARVEAEAVSRGHDGVYLDVGIENHDARRLYERLGYLVEGEPVERGWHRPNLTARRASTSPKSSSACSSASSSGACSLAPLLRSAP